MLSDFYIGEWGFSAMIGTCVRKRFGWFSRHGYNSKRNISRLYGI